MFEENRVLRLLRGEDPVFVAAPMVRYSKLPFRILCHRWGCHVTHTPMILADSFIISPKARDSEFVTNSDDHPLVVQFAAKKPSEFAVAAELVAKCADGVDLNCGCPQSWAIKDGIGCGLLKDPELIRNMVKEATSRSELPISIKIRVNSDLRVTVDLAQKVQAAGVSWITVHGRTPSQRSSTPADPSTVKIVKESIDIPVVINGDVFSRDDALKLHEGTGVDGFMAARGLLQNPALFSGHATTPIECVSDYLDILARVGSHSFVNTHHHLQFMLYESLSGAERKRLSSCASLPGAVSFLSEFGISSSKNG